MKKFLIFLMLCFFGLQTAWSETARMHHLTIEQVREYFGECEQQFNMTTIKNPGLFKFLHVTHFLHPGPKTDKMICTAACVMKKFTSSRGKTLYVGTLDFIEEVYAEERQWWSSNVTAEDLKSKVRDCYAKERDECGFYKCLDLFKPPFLYFQAPKGLVLAVFRYMTTKLHEKNSH